MFRSVLTVVAALGAMSCMLQEPPRTAGISALSDRSEAAAQGHRLAASRCGGCHATGPNSASPRSGAPSFVDVSRRRDLAALEADFARGVVTGHPDMPLFVFRAAEIDDLIAYLETLEADR